MSISGTGGNDARIRRAAELLFVLTGPALYRDFVLEAGWTPRDWTRWVSSTLIRDLLRDQ